MSTTARLLITLALALFLVACGSKDVREEDDGRLAADIYRNAKLSLDRRNWERAIEQYKLLQSRYPFGRYTEQAQLELAYAYYRSKKPEEAESTINRFIKTYPAHSNIDYALYLRGLNNFDRDGGFLSRLKLTDPTQRTQESGRQAFLNFEELLRDYPDSRYASDARERMLYLRESMAEHEMHVARYYYRRKAFVASANRAKNVVENYPQTPQVADALAMMTLAYEALEMDELASDSRRVLGLNYPDHEVVIGDEQGVLSWLWPFGDDD